MTKGQVSYDAAPIKNLRHLIASVISGYKAYDVPSVCTRYGLAEGTNEDAFRSKYKYVIQRVQSLPADEVLRVARALQADEGSAEFGEALAKIDEKSSPRITPLTRRRIVAELDNVSLSGELPEIDFLRKLWPIDSLPSPNPTLDEYQMVDFLIRHRIRNDDLSNKDVLEYLGIYECSQRQLFRLLEAVLDPLTREIPEQVDLAARLNRHLAQDGFRIDETGKMSGSPIYEVRYIGKAGSTPADSEIAKALLAFNPDEIHARWQEALARRAADPRAAITLARTLLEDTCKWLLHEANESFKDDDDLPVLYRRLAKALKLAPDDHTEQIFKQILGSCQSIVEAIGSIRNKLGDAHSQGPKRARPQARHAELAVNLAGTMATFLIATWGARQQVHAKRNKVGHDGGT
jgi:hypothetical protein